MPCRFRLDLPLFGLEPVCHCRFSLHLPFFGLRPVCHVGLASIGHFLALDPCAIVGLASICHLLVLDLHLKAMGPIYGSLAIRLLYFIGPWSLSPHLKWSLISRVIIHEILIDRVESAYDEEW